jgi:hypothetical protein
MTMLDQIGNLNPQLLRELKGRFNGRNILTVGALSIVAQVLVFLWFYGQLPTPEAFRYNAYCGHMVAGEFIQGCSEDVSANTFVIDWTLWWQHFAQTLHTCIPFVLMVSGTYFLLSDLQNEERQGTLDFVRLSPRSASSILLGKILGVTILVYCAISSLLPLHIFVTSKAGNLSFLLSFYTMLAAGSYLIFSFTLLFGFFSKSILKRSAQALGVTIFYVLMVGAIFVPGYIMWNSETVWKALLPAPIFYISSPDSSWFWFSLPISHNTAIAHLFTLLNIAILNGWIWQGLTRCFHQPSTTILRKRQSYGLVFYLQSLVLGLSFQTYVSKGASAPEAFGTVLLPIVLNLLIFLTLTAILSPQRQAVMDWARYRQTQSPRSSLLQDLLFHDHSPAGLAMVVNLAIAGILWLGISSFGSQRIWNGTQPNPLLVLISLIALALYAAIVQWLAIQKTSKRNFIAIALLTILLLIPSAFVALLSSRGLISTTVRDIVLLTSPFLWSISPELLSPLSVVSSLLGQLSLIAGINALTARQVRQIGASEMKDQFTRLKAQ